MLTKPTTATHVTKMMTIHPTPAREVPAKAVPQTIQVPTITESARGDDHLALNNQEDDQVVQNALKVP